ncbi:MULTISPECIES: TonB-dependent receptor [unclassified Sphingobium]|uniref:TonB-dependent receptor n=1 Tax=unclassified Sphingobium TaxID=2611147 RepID=UPI000D17D2CE|nr:MULTISPECIES: TonB-dependent receptor [unclassified Sphingobium]MBG6119984.1 iron complex outermembrane receptor protein [Sphingobium sp. JAI105]PSO11849.1 hypothetical protein C7E20_10405 [Sphingobium sp. AEW4]TWC99577.1 iron complex outermembrane receptor protein [Sphingobium sp. AEW010]TWD18986.1 iron complex outermembrane receptor protein [Sphingobium sp. AEW013]TWD21857.1 iron complex outermembrane receptor protein [Sphingobium sp. AEW001]
MTYHQTRRRFMRLGLLLSGSLCAFAPSVHAQEIQSPQADQAFESTDIIVTAQKRQENLQDVPLSITALGSQALENRGINNIAGLQTAGLPGVQIQPFGGQQSVIEVQIRGATTSSSSDAGRESSTAIYLDDVYQPRAQSGALSLVDPARIEILRGPQGQLFGRGATGGAMRIVSGEPTGELGGRVTASYGNYDAQKYEAHINLPSIGGFSFKFDGVIDKRDGFTKNIKSPNIARANDFALKDDKGFRVSVKWQPSPDFKAVYAFNYIDSFTTTEWNQAIPRPSFLPAIALPTPAAQAFYGATAIPIWRGPVPLRATRPDQSWTPLYLYGFDTQSRQQSLRMEYNANDDITIRSITGLGYLRMDSMTANGGPIVAPTNLPGITFDVSQLVPWKEAVAGVPTGSRIYGIIPGNSQSYLKSRFFSQELQVVGDMGEHQWVAGLYYSNEKIRQQASNANAGVFYDPVNTGAAVVRNFGTFLFTNPFYTNAAQKAGLYTTVDSRSFAIFGQETWSPEALDSKLHLTVGIRYTDDQKSGLRTTDGQAVAGTILTNISLPVLTAKRFDPAATIAYDITPNNNIYYRFSRAYKAGGYNLVSSSVVLNGVPRVINFTTEVNTAHEIGLKNEFFDRRLRLNIVGFYSEILGQQLNVFAIPPGGITPIASTINAPGKTKTYGAEVEATLFPTRGLSIGLNYAYLHQKLPVIPVALDPQLAPNFIPAGATQISPAMYFPSNSPPHTISGNIDYDTEFADFGTFYVHLDGSYSSMFRTTNRQSAGNYLVPRRLQTANGRIGVRDIDVGATKLNLSFFMNNITNNNARQGGSGFGDVFFMPPRTFGGQLTASF